MISDSSLNKKIKKDMGVIYLILQVMRSFLLAVREPARLVVL